jgi:hypothetical protein
VPGGFALRVFAAAAAALPALGAEQFSVQAEGRGSEIAIEARATVSASLPVAWATLTDYDHLADFIPGLDTSRTLSRNGAIVTVEQRGEMKFLFFHFPIEAVIEADESYPLSIEARMIRGNIRLLSAGYRLAPTPAPGRLVLRWSGVVQPQFWIPMFISVSAVREHIETQFRAMVEEIERRQAARGPAG